MDLIIIPSKLSGTVKIPSSKSLTHRAIISAALANGTSTIKNIIYSHDIVATIYSMEKLGATFDMHDDYVIVNGINNTFPSTIENIDCNESGSTLRFLIPIFSLCNTEITFNGSKKLYERPLTIYEEIYNDQKLEFKLSESQLITKGSLKPKKYSIKGNISSQFISGMLFTLPLLKEDSIIEITGLYESKAYVDLTIDILSKYGITITENNNTYIIKGNQKYTAHDYYIEGDYSQFAFFAVAGMFNNEIKCLDMNTNSIQGDKAILNIIKSMNGKIDIKKNQLNALPSKTTSTTIDLSQCPDLGPIIAVLAATSTGTTTIVNADRLRLKESNRLSVMVEILTSLGIESTETKDGMIITGSSNIKGGITLDSHNDHRIAMSIAIISTVCEKPLILTNADAINKSYPHFFEDFEKIGGQIDILGEL